MVSHRFCEDRGADAVDPQTARQFDGRPLHKAVDQTVDGLPMVPSCMYSSVRTPDTSVNDFLSAINGSAARTSLIWPVPLDLIEFALVLCSRGARNTSPAAFATALKDPMRLKRASGSWDRKYLPGNHRTYGRQTRPRVPSPPTPSLRRTRWFRSDNDCFHLIPLVRFEIRSSVRAVSFLWHRGTVRPVRLCGLMYSRILGSRL